MDDPQDDAALGALLRRHAPRHAPPPALAERIRAQLRESAMAAQAMADVPTPQSAANARSTPAAGQPARPTGLARPAPAWRRWLQALSFYAAGAASAALAASLLLTVQPTEDLDAEVTASHVRSLQADHLRDVPSSDRHTVKPWFAGKLDFSPPVFDLAAQGFALAGGRLDYLDGRPVAALVYRSGAHVINLFVWPAPPGRHDSPPQADTRQGYHLLHWTAAGMQAWAVSDMAPDELQRFAEGVRARMLAPDAAEAPGAPGAPGASDAAGGAGR